MTATVQTDRGYEAEIAHKKSFVLLLAGILAITVVILLHRATGAVLNRHAKLERTLGGEPLLSGQELPGGAVLVTSELSAAIPVRTRSAQSLAALIGSFGPQSSGISEAATARPSRTRCRQGSSGRSDKWCLATQPGRNGRAFEARRRGSSPASSE